MLEFIGLLFLIFVGWKIVRWWVQTTHDQSYLEGKFSSMGLDEVRAEREKVFRRLCYAHQNPGTPESDGIQRILEETIRAEDRINQLTDGEHGPAFRAKRRTSIIFELNYEASRASARHNENAYVSDEFDAEPDIPNPDSPESGYPTWEDWLDAFKREAGRENSALRVDAEGSSLIDFMVLDPLKRAYSDGVEPMKLARQYAAEFDLSKLRGDSA